MFPLIWPSLVAPAGNNELVESGGAPRLLVEGEPVSSGTDVTVTARLMLGTSAAAIAAANIAASAVSAAGVAPSGTVTTGVAAVATAALGAAPSSVAAAVFDDMWLPAMASRQAPGPFVGPQNTPRFHGPELVWADAPNTGLVVEARLLLGFTAAALGATNLAATAAAAVGVTGPTVAAPTRAGIASANVGVTQPTTATPGAAAVAVANVGVTQSGTATPGAAATATAALGVTQQAAMSPTRAGVATGNVGVTGNGTATHDRAGVNATINFGLTSFGTMVVSGDYTAVATFNAGMVPSAIATPTRAGAATGNLGFTFTGTTILGRTSNALLNAAVTQLAVATPARAGQATVNMAMAGTSVGVRDGTIITVARFGATFIGVVTFTGGATDQPGWMIVVGVVYPQTTINHEAPESVIDIVAAPSALVEPSATPTGEATMIASPQVTFEWMEN